MQTPKESGVVVGAAVAVSVVAGSLSGCGLFGDGPLPLPFAQVMAVQLFEEPNFTVALTVESAVSNPSKLEKINWVFGDGSGFVAGANGRASITHRYESAGTYEVTAFVFDSVGLVGQINGTAVVAGNGNGQTNPEPSKLPGGISGPNPEDGAEGTPTDVTLTWTGSGAASSYDVYLGTDPAAVEAATDADGDVFRGSHTETEFDPQNLTPDTQYFWRVDEFNEAGLAKGEVLSFTTAAAPKGADDYDPADGVTTAPVTQVLRWTAGKGATSHDVYFGKDQAAVADAVPEANDVFQGNQASPTFDPADEEADLEGELLSATQYYWRIDEVGPGGTFKGSVRGFRTAAPPPQITGPIPADQSADVNVNQNLSWSAAPSVEGFDAYFGIDPVAVDSATRASGEFKGHQSSTIFDLGGLLGETDYYWRIDTLGPGGTRHGTVLTFRTASPPLQVVGPFVPPDNETNVDVEVLLSWNPGGATDSYDVYFGTDEIAVGSGQASVFQGNQDASEAALDPGSLTANAVYFWRVDALGPGGTTTGPVLRFRTGALPDQAQDPVPSIGRRGVALDADLEWTAGLGAVGHGVYLGTNQSAVQGADQDDAEFEGNVAGATFDPGDLTGNTEYFWRIDATSPGGTTPGEVWRFKTAPERATNPTPPDAETGEALDVQPGWTAGDGAVSHDAYLGSNEAAVAAATPDDDEFQGNQTATTFDPGELAGATVYYWRVDELGGPEDGTTPGEVWSFTTAAGAAAEPIYPENGSTGIELMPTFTWTAGVGAVSHDVYVGSIRDAVETATRADVPFEVNQMGTSYTVLLPLVGTSSHYWRIDEIDADGNATKGEVWQFRTGTGQARDPVPVDSATGVDVNTTLAWTQGMGVGTVSHGVYLGTDAAAVEAATPETAGIFQGNQSDLTFVPPAPFDSLTTYYWRIDEAGPTGTTKGAVWSFSTGAGQARDPDPADGSAGTSLQPLLTWTPDAGAASHDVYFGTSHSAVAAATRTSNEFQGNQAAAIFSPAALAGLTFHYWRVDEIDSEGNATAGDVWQFRTGPGQASNPVPTDFEFDVPLWELLQWSGGIGASEHRVYFGTSLAAVTNADTGDPEFKGSQVGEIFDPGTLAADTTHYWRIDEVAADGTTVTRGSVWRFTTLSAPGSAGSPSPFNGATDVSVDVTLSWAAASGATSYDVYFSAVEADVISGDAFQGNRTPRSYSPGTLAADTTYYWRIDAVNGAGTTAGGVWSFTTAP